jgi:hypothetical protein
MNFILRLFLTASSVSFFVIVYLFQNEIYHYKKELGNFWMLLIPIYLIIPFFATGISLFLCKFLSSDTLNSIKSIETSNNDFLANYLAFFFVALSVKDNNMIVFWVVFGMTVLFTFVSRVSYFNPMFLIFGFNFYYVHTSDNVKVMLITRSKLKKPSDLNIESVKRINDYTFIEI